jgi:hypothetical protein
MSAISSHVNTYELVQNSQIQIQEPEVQKDKKPEIQNTEIQNTEIQNTEIQEQTKSKVKVKKVEEQDPAYEKLKLKEVGFLARTAMKTFAHMEISELVKKGIVKEGDAKHTHLKKLVESKPKTYGDLDKIATEVTSCLFGEDEVGKEKGILRIKKFFTTYDSRGIGAALSELKKNSCPSDKKIT